MSMTEQRSTSALLYLSGVTVSFDGFKALNNLSLLVEPGEMRAIIGPNGAGKTTMMDVVTGKTRPDEGEVVFDGRADLTKLDEADIATLGIGRKFQKPTVFENHTVRDNLLLALAGLRSWYRLLLAAPTKAENDRLDEILSIIRMEPQQHMLGARLSHGQKQWLEIGMLLAQDPKLLLVDEPVAGMTDVETETTAQVLREINTHAFGRRGRARHELRARARRQGDGAARGLDAGRGHARPGERRSARRRSLSRAMSDARGPERRSLLRRRPGAALGVAQRRRSAG